MPTTETPSQPLTIPTPDVARLADPAAVFAAVQPLLDHVIARGDLSDDDFTDVQRLVAALFAAGHGALAIELFDGASNVPSLLGRVITQVPILDEVMPGMREYALAGEETAGERDAADAARGAADAARQDPDGAPLPDEQAQAWRLSRLLMPTAGTSPTGAPLIGGTWTRTPVTARPFTMEDHAVLEAVLPRLRAQGHVTLALTMTHLLNARFAATVSGGE